ncbi:hypothetical protein DPMN_035893 [Dreissena polymorpha]|uniref:Uncharacterized protein n=1 Tax=Dreissena polymorpha TaxID=45954 RepID=A0A9D4M9Z7_DREPO|nr:hypothetical protein DPMN_035893 [Dreissena polymorpha]
MAMKKTFPSASSHRSGPQDIAPTHILNIPKKQELLVATTVLGWSATLTITRVELSSSILEFGELSVMQTLVKTMHVSYANWLGMKL